MKTKTEGVIGGRNMQVFGEKGRGYIDQLRQELDEERVWTKSLTKFYARRLIMEVDVLIDENNRLTDELEIAHSQTNKDLEQELEDERDWNKILTNDLEEYRSNSQRIYDAIVKLQGEIIID